MRRREKMERRIASWKMERKISMTTTPRRILLPKPSEILLPKSLAGCTSGKSAKSVSLDGTLEDEEATPRLRICETPVPSPVSVIDDESVYKKRAIAPGATTDKAAKNSADPALMDNDEERKISNPLLVQGATCNSPACQEKIRSLESQLETEIDRYLGSERRCAALQKRNEELERTVKELQGNPLKPGNRRLVASNDCNHQSSPRTTQSNNGCKTSPVMISGFVKEPNVGAMVSALVPLPVPPPGFSYPPPDFSYPPPPFPVGLLPVSQRSPNEDVEKTIKNVKENRLKPRNNRLMSNSSSHSSPRELGMDQSNSSRKASPITNGSTNDPISGVPVSIPPLDFSYPPPPIPIELLRVSKPPLLESKKEGSRPHLLPDPRLLPKRKPDSEPLPKRRKGPSRWGSPLVYEGAVTKSAKW